MLLGCKLQCTFYLTWLLCSPLLAGSHMSYFYRWTRTVTCWYVCIVCMHKKEPQKPPEHTSDHVKSPNFLSACPQTPSQNLYYGPCFLYLPWAPLILSVDLDHTLNCRPRRISIDPPQQTSRYHCRPLKQSVWQLQHGALPATSHRCAVTQKTANREDRARLDIVATPIHHTTRSHSSHNALHSPSIHFKGWRETCYQITLSFRDASLHIYINLNIHVGEMFAAYSLYLQAVHNIALILAYLMILILLHWCIKLQWYRKKGNHQVMFQ